jgi:hypothetical protein
MSYEYGKRINFIDTYNSVFLYRMDLKQKFLAVSTGRIINIMDLDLGVKYPIVYGDHLGSSVILTLNVNGDRNVRMYLPKRYASVCTKGDILHINGGRDRWKLVNRGLCSTSNNIILSLEI